MKEAKSKISMVTCYDFWTAQIINQSAIDAILVGDSLAMVVHGHSTTIPASIEMLALHTQAVSRGATNKIIVADMPFLSVRKGLENAVNCVDLLMKSGATAIKIEGVDGHESIIEHIVKSGVPVMGHLGFTPQSVHQLGGPKVQGRDTTGADAMLSQARKLEDLGCFGLVLECVPEALAGMITDNIHIPTIGIGAGAQVSGQILVLQDLLGMLPQFKFKFVRQYFDGFKLFSEALNRFDHDVKERQFPTETESFI